MRDKFTDKFIKFPVREFNVKHKELTGVEDLKDTWIKINPLDISSYRLSHDEENDDREIVIISMKSGDETVTPLTINEFEKLLNEWQ